MMSPDRPDDVPTRILPAEQPSRARRSTPTPDPDRPFEVIDDAATVDAQGRIVLTVRSRSGRVVACYAVPVGRSAVMARDILGRPSEPATSSHPTTLPPAPDGPLDARGGWTVPVALGLTEARPWPAWTVYCGVAVAFLVGLLIRSCGVVR